MTSLCCSENHTKSFSAFLVCSLALCKILPQKLLCAQQKPSLLIPVTGIIEGQKVKTTCCVTFSQFRDFLCTQHLCVGSFLWNIYFIFKSPTLD